MKIVLPPGPADGPARASRSACRSWGSSVSACRSSPESTVALALREASVLTVAEFACTVTCAEVATIVNRRSRFPIPESSVILAGCAVVERGRRRLTVTE